MIKTGSVLCSVGPYRIPHPEFVSRTKNEDESEQDGEDDDMLKAKQRKGITRPLSQLPVQTLGGDPPAFNKALPLGHGGQCHGLVVARHSGVQFLRLFLPLSLTVPLHDATQGVILITCDFFMSLEMTTGS